jgi:hypothetical protein
VTTPATAIDLTQLGCVLRTRLPIPCSYRQWRTAGDLSEFITVDGFLRALAVFVAENRAALSGVRLSNTSLDRRIDDCPSITDFPVCLHPSLHCWYRDGKDSQDLEKLVQSTVRCTPQWYGGQEWRRDHVWVQEYNSADNRPWEGRLVGKLLTTITVIDYTGTGERYTGALVEVLRYRNQGKPHPVHGMVEVEPWPSSTARSTRVLGGCRFYSMSTVLRGAHVIPSNVEEVLYINNYIDWDQYNTIYDEDFESSGKAAADEVFSKYARSYVE